MSYDFFDSVRQAAIHGMADAFMNGFEDARAGRRYGATGFVQDEPRPEPGSDGPPKMRAVLASLARAKGLLRRSDDTRRRVARFNDLQKLPNGRTINVPCTVVH